jgi:hypothetical protein
MIIRVRRSKRFLRRVKLMLRMMRRFKCGFCKRFAFPGLFALLVPYAVSAQTVPVSLVLATGPNSVTCEEGRRMFRDVQAIYQSLGVNLRLRWFRCLPNPRRRQTLLEGYGVDDAHWWWDEDYFVGPRRKGDKVAHHALIPPVEYRGDLYIVGQSYQFQCYWRSGGRVSMTSAMMTNAKGAPRYRHSVVAMAHEIGHSLGLEHDETLPVSIMHPAPLASVDASKSWLPWPKSAFEKLTTCKEKEIRNGAAR